MVVVECTEVSCHRPGHVLATAEFANIEAGVSAASPKGNGEQTKSIFAPPLAIRIEALSCITEGSQVLSVAKLTCKEIESCAGSRIRAAISVAVVEV